MTHRYQKAASPAGMLHLVEKAGKLRAVLFDAQWGRMEKLFEDLEEAETPVLKKAKKQLAEYFSGRRRSFDVPFDLEGTPFQKRVWRGLAQIPYGQTRSYKQQAAALKAPQAVRAVGRTNGLNRLCIVLPCHRVVGSDGSLTGYAGGLKAKEFLLALESGSSFPPPTKTFEGRLQRESSRIC
jgi:methylated-DNA-[protein]-cysteine S-methyltransferase